MTMQDIILSARNLPPVPLNEVSAYQAQAEIFTQKVNAAMDSLPDIHTLIGHAPLQMMYDNHTHHAAFMSTVFSIQDYELLARTIPWVYRSYHAHRFSYAYFTLELTTWIQTLKAHPDCPFSTIIQIYEWMIHHHEAMIHLSESDHALQLPVSEDWLEKKNAFQVALLNGDHVTSLSIADAVLEAEQNLNALYLHIIQPVMYEIGILWERARITVAHEHLASAIVSRIMAIVGSRYQRLFTPNNRKALITTAPNEFHEIGAWMVADMFTQAGWEVRYLGANTPKDDLLALMVEFKPHILGISVTMAFNIHKARAIVKAVKSHPDLEKITVCVGGRIFCEHPELWRSVGADRSMPPTGNISDLIEAL